MNRIEISTLVLNDRTAVFEMLQDPAVMRFIGPRRPLSDYEAEQWFQDALDNPTRFVFRMVRGGDLVGFCGLKRMGGVDDFGYHMRKEFWGKGLAQEMCRIAVSEIEKERDLHSIFVFIADENIASRRVAESMGWTRLRAHTKDAEKGAVYLLRSISEAG